MKKERKNWKNLSIFQKTSLILIGVLLLVIIIQIGYAIHLKQKYDYLKRKNDEVSSQLPDQSEAEQSWKTLYLKYINNLK